MKVKEIGRRRWKKESGYYQQARVENTFFRNKAIIGPRLRARYPGGVTTSGGGHCLQYPQPDDRHRKARIFRDREVSFADAALTKLCFVAVPEKFRKVSELLSCFDSCNNAKGRQGGIACG